MQDPDAVDLGYKKIAAQRAHSMADEELARPGQLLPYNVLQERYQRQLEQEFALFRGRLKNGASKIVEMLQGTNSLSQDVVDAFYTISEHKNLADIGDETVDKLYQAAKTLYEQTRYEDAHDAFLFLTNVNPNKYALWLGLANCLYCLERYREAIGPYANAGEVNPSDPNSYLLLSRCYSELGEFDNAARALDSALQAVEGNKEFYDWKVALQEEKAQVIAKGKGYGIAT